MRLRSVHVLIGAIALLVLGAGVGSAILLPARRPVVGPPQVTGGLVIASPGVRQTASTRVPNLVTTTAFAHTTAVTANSTAPTSVASAQINTVTTTDTALSLPANPQETQIVPTPAGGASSPIPSRPAPTQAAKTLSTVAPPVVLALSTDVPVPTINTSERVGGPVSVPNAHSGPRWVTLQVGHLHNENFPPELSHLLGNTGAFAGGVSEVELNEAMAHKAAALLIARGYNVDILDATVPIGYTTDLFLAIHADGSESTSTRGFKATPPWNSVPASDDFVRILYEEYGKATGMPSDPVTSVGMADYYAFNPVTYRHALNPTVPGTLLEMGFVTNPEDRHIMTQEQDRVSFGIANSVDRYFRSGAAGNTPTPYPSFTPTPSPTSTPTPTSTSTSTPTSTPTNTSTPIPTEFVDGATATAALITPIPSTATPKPPRSTSTPVPTPTPLRGIVTSDGRWLPPLSPHVRGLPQPGTLAAPVLLTAEDDERLMTASGRDQVQNWQQFYIPELGRSIWKPALLRQVRH